MPQPFINPNYLNTYPNAYPYQPQIQPPMDRLQQLQAPYQMPQQTQVPQVPQTNQGILWVQGEAGAKSYLVAPSTSILLMECHRTMIMTAHIVAHVENIMSEDTTVAPLDRPMMTT